LIRFCRRCQWSTRLCRRFTGRRDYPKCFSSCPGPCDHGKRHHKLHAPGGQRATWQKHHRRRSHQDGSPRGAHAEQQTSEPYWVFASGTVCASWGGRQSGIDAVAHCSCCARHGHARCGRGL
jgi:hypothetical protein